MTKKHTQQASLQIRHITEWLVYLTLDVGHNKRRTI